jgi:eukaryotic-like serine/threonine-protein kinase
LATLLSVPAWSQVAAIPVAQEPRHHVEFANEMLRVISPRIPAGDTTLDHLGSFAAANAGLYSRSENGVLAYRVGAGGDQRQLNWLDNRGKEQGTVADRGSYDNPALSPDGRRVAVAQFDRQDGNSNIWVVDLSRGNSTKVTFNPGRNDFPVWSPDGKSIVFASNRSGPMDLYSKNADGTGEERLLLKSEADKRANSWSRDGRFLLYTETNPKTRQDLWILPDPGTATKETKPIPWLRTEFVESQGSFSPDGRWIAYISSESGGPEVYVRPFYPEKIEESAGEGRWMVSKNGGINSARWRADGKELVYPTTTLQVMAVSVSPGKTFQFEAPRLLFTVPLLAPFDVTADGKRFLIAAPEGSSAPSPFTVVTNWQAALKK